MSMQIQKPKIFLLEMKVSYHLFDSVDRRVVLGRRIDVAAIQIYTIGIDSVVTSGYSIGVEDWEEIKYEPIP